MNEWKQTYSLFHSPAGEAIKSFQEVYEASGQTSNPSSAFYVAVQMLS